MWLWGQFGLVLLLTADWLPLSQDLNSCECRWYFGTLPLLSMTCYNRVGGPEYMYVTPGAICKV